MEAKPRQLSRGLIILIPIVWAVLVSVILNFTSPISSGPPGVLAVLILLYLLAASGLYALLRAIGYLSARFFKRTLGRRHSLYMASVLALGPIFLLALNTLGNIGLPELILVTLFVVLGCFYVTRRMITE